MLRNGCSRWAKYALERERVLPSQRATELTLQCSREFEGACEPDMLTDRFESLLERVCELSRLGQVADRDERVTLALEWLNSHLDFDNPLAEVAKRAGLAETSFRHVFRQRFGQSFGRWLCSLRLEESRRLLVQTAQTISAIAERVGFREIHAYERNFRRAYAMTPLAFRKHAGASRLRLP